MRNSRRDLLKAAVLLLTVPMLSGAGQAPPPRRVTFTAEQKADLDTVSAYLNSIQTLSASFVQISGGSSFSQGEFFLSRPGRLRFEYAPPSPSLIVATAGHIYVKNNRLNTVDRWDVSDTPLGLLLAPGIDLKNNTAVLGIERQDQTLVLRARTSTNRTSANITIVFGTQPQLSLRQWQVKDVQGGTTDVALSQVHSGVVLDDSLFAVPVKAPKIKP